jgi:hypothetical protein
MKTPDAVLQEVWKIKDAAYAQAGSDSQRFVDQLRQRSEQLRQGLGLKEWTISAPAPADSAAPPVLPS